MEKFLNLISVINTNFKREFFVFIIIGISFPNLHLTDPLSYLKFNYISKNSMAVITDSGGIT